MKKLIILLAVCFALQSCGKRCYTCTGMGDTDIYCHGDAYYEQIKDGFRPTDINGNQMECSPM